MGCLRCGLVTIITLLNFLVFACGVTMLALGIWAFNVEDTCMHGVIMESIDVPVIIIISAGIIIMLTAFLGCYSTCNETKKGIISYSIFSLTVILLQVIGCCLLFAVYRSQVERLTNDYKEKCSIDQTPKNFQITKGTFELIYYVITGCTIFSVICELLALILIVCQYQDIY